MLCFVLSLGGGVQGPTISVMLMCHSVYMQPP